MPDGDKTIYITDEVSNKLLYNRGRGMSLFSSDIFHTASSYFPYQY